MPSARNPLIVSLVILVVATLVSASVGLYIYLNKAKLEKINLDQTQELSSLKNQKESDSKMLQDLISQKAQLEILMSEKVKELSSLKAQIGGDNLAEPNDNSGNLKKTAEIDFLRSQLESLQAKYDDITNVAKLPQRKETIDGLKFLFEHIYQTYYSPSSSLSNIFEKLKRTDKDFFPTLENYSSLFQLHMERILIEGVITNSPQLTIVVHTRIRKEGSDFSVLLKKHLSLGLIRIPGQSNEAVKTLYSNMISILSVFEDGYVPPKLDETKIGSFPNLSLRPVMCFNDESEDFPLIFRFRYDGELTDIYQKNHKSVFFEAIKMFYNNLHNICIGSSFNASLFANSIKDIVSSTESFAHNFINFLNLRSFQKVKVVQYKVTDPIWIKLKREYLAELICNHFTFNEECVRESQ